MLLLPLLPFFVTLEQHVSGAETRPNIFSLTCIRRLSLGNCSRPPLSNTHLRGILSTPVNARSGSGNGSLRTCGRQPFSGDVVRAQQLCHGPGAGDADADWLGLGRSWSIAEVPLELKSVNHDKHDVGGIPFP